MKPACVAIVGKSNNPIFVQTFEGGSSTEDELKYHFIVHTSLDVVEEKVAAKEKQGSLDSYLGLLYPTEDYNVYGYVTATGTKLILVLDDTGLEASRIRSFFKEFHSLYCDTVSNPFHEVGSPIKSSRFKERLAQILTH